MIRALCLNPNIDRSYTIRNFIPGFKYKELVPEITAGGKGVNVAKALHCLGGTSVLYCFLGGQNGKFIKEAQKLQIYEISGQYTGHVCILHGKQDKIVPYSYAVKYDELYKNSDLHLIDDEGHFLTKHKKDIIGTVVSFMKLFLLKPEC